jgi:hypothetical protein
MTCSGKNFQDHFVISGDIDACILTASITGITSQIGHIGKTDGPLCAVFKIAFTTTLPIDYIGLALYYKYLGGDAQLADFGSDRAPSLRMVTSVPEFFDMLAIDTKGNIDIGGSILQLLPSNEYILYIPTSMGISLTKDAYLTVGN